MSFVFRFAPSPTGNLHVGGVRTALFNFLAARSSDDGKYLLRIEDTDTLRSSQAYVDNILEGLKWLAIEHDGDVYYQSAHIDRYQSYRDKLLQQGVAYRCYCSPQVLDQKREQALKEGRKPKYDGTCRNLHPTEWANDRSYCIRVKFPEVGETAYDDLFRGTITTPNAEMDDLIIQRSDGGFSYNFAVVCDDSEMGITHVLRGDDHINNTPRQIVLYDLLGKEPPRFGHFPMILGTDKKRLSKRHGATAVTEYRLQGILPMALVNFLVRLGWSHGDEELFFSMDDLISKFNLQSIGKSPAVFNEEKLLWINQQHLKQIRPRDALRMAFELKEASVPEPTEAEKQQLFEKLVGDLKERAHTLVDLYNDIQFYFSLPEQIEEAGRKKFMIPAHKEIFLETLNRLKAVSDENWTEEELQNLFKGLAAEKNLKMVDLAQPVRLCLTGRTATPSLFLIMAAFGKAETLLRLERGTLLF